MKNLNGNVTVNKIKKNQRQLLLNLSHIVREWYSDFWMQLQFFLFFLANFSQKWAASQKKKNSCIEKTMSVFFGSDC